MTQELIDRRFVTYGEDFIAETELSYFLLKPERPEEKMYGVRILKESIENGAHVSEDNSTDLLFPDAGEALTFLKMLIKYEVTPIALTAVLEDYLSDYEVLKDALTA